MNKIPNFLYHYTSIEAVLAIIKSLDNKYDEYNNITLRATHVSFLNDLTEGCLLPKALASCGIPKRTMSIVLCCPGYPFILSFSELNDDLNMWRCYARDGKGVSLSFDTTSFCQNSEIRLEKCIYITPEALKDKILSRCDVEELRQTENTLPLGRFLQDACNYKDSSFHAEKEWRIIKSGPIDDFRTREETIIPYAEIKVPKEALVSIVLGPKCVFDKNAFSLNRLLYKYGMGHVRIEQSAIPLV